MRSRPQRGRKTTLCALSAHFLRRGSRPFLFCLPPRRGNKREKRYRKRENPPRFSPSAPRGTGGTDKAVPPVPKGVAEPRRSQGTEKFFLPQAQHRKIFSSPTEPLTPPRTCRRGGFYPPARFGVHMNDSAFTFDRSDPLRPSGFSFCKFISNSINHRYSLVAMVQ